MACSSASRDAGRSPPSGARPSAPSGGRGDASVRGYGGRMTPAPDPWTGTAVGPRRRGPGSRCRRRSWRSSRSSACAAASAWHPSARPFDALAALLLLLAPAGLVLVVRGGSPAVLGAVPVGRRTGDLPGAGVRAGSGRGAARLRRRRAGCDPSARAVVGVRDGRCARGRRPRDCARTGRTASTRR